MTWIVATDAWLALRPCGPAAAGREAFSGKHCLPRPSAYCDTDPLCLPTVEHVADRQQTLLHDRGLDYYGRLDTDSRIAAPLKEDVFQYMRDRNLKYGWVVGMTEQPSARPPQPLLSLPRTGDCAA